VTWSLAVVAPSSEFRVASVLERWKYPHHVFKVRRRVCRRGRTYDRLFPAFPSYIFIAANGLWWELRERCEAIIDFVRGDSGYVAILPDATLTSLLARSSNGVLSLPEIPARFHQGERVLIRGAGPLAGQTATFQHLIDENSALVEIDWLGRWCPVNIDERDLDHEHEAPKPGRRKRRRRRRRHNRAADPPA
jgi:hypothetical protein